MNAAPTTSVGIGHNNPPSEEDDALNRDGWVAIARAMRGHWLVGFGKSVEPADPDFGSHSRTEAWLDLIMECRYQAGTVNNNGRKMRLEPGQLVGATSWLASRWNWTPKTVRGFLDKLEEEGMIVRNLPGTRPWSEDSQGASEQGTAKGTNKGRFANVLTVSKYSIYQLAHREKGPVERPVAGQVEGQLRAGSGPVEGHIYKEEQGNKGTREPNTDSSQSVAARERANGIAEIGGLNGATSLIVSDVAGWLNPYAPDLEFARKQVAEALRIYGDIAVRDGYAELKADIADGKVRAPTVKSLYGYFRTAKDRKPKAGSQKEADMRKLDAIVGPRR